MKAPAKLTAFAAMLLVLFGGGALAGGAIDPSRDRAGAGHAGAGAHGSHEDGDTPAADPVRGLAVAANGLRLVVDDPERRLGRAERLAFRIVDPRGATVRDFDLAHDRRMHLIVVRRDLTGFQHLHPVQQDDGSWSVPLTLADAGSYRVFADFTVDGVATTLASDLRVDGRADLVPLPAASATAVAGDGYDVRLTAGRVRPGREAGLRFTITRNGRPVRTEPYLGAGGHLVALREGDLAFLHVHPTGDGPGRAVDFAATFPTTGRYRLYLQFQHAGRVRTAAFTQEVE